MMDLFLLVVYLIVFIAEIILLVKSIKRKENKYWIKLFLIEIIFIVISFVLWIYYDSLPGYGFMPGLSYWGEILFSIGACFLYSAMLFITTCSRIIIFEKKQKQQGKKYANPLVSIIALIFIVIGIIYLANEIINNWGKKETIGTIVNYEDVQTGEGVEYWPIISFYVNGKEYSDHYPMSNTEIGDNVKIYYYFDSVNEKYHITRYITNNKFIYISAFIIGILIFIFKFKDNILYRMKMDENKESIK